MLISESEHVSLQPCGVSLCNCYFTLFQSEDDKSFLVPIKVEWIWIFSAQICWQMWVLSSGILQSLRARPRKGTAARLHIYWCHREISYTEASRGKILWALCTHFRKWVFLGGRRTYNCSQICLLRRKAGKYFFNSRRNSARRRYEPRKSATPKIAEQRRQGERYIYLGFHSGKMSPSSGLSDPCRQK